MTDPLVSISGMFISITHTTAHTWSCVTSGHLLTSHAAKPPSWYWAITDTLENSKHQTVGHVAAMLAIIWAIFIHISIPSLLWQQAKAHEEISACLVNTSLISYIIYSICGALYIPPVLLIILYGQIYTNTWNHILTPLLLYGKYFNISSKTARSLLCSFKASLHEGHSYLISSPLIFNHVKIKLVDSVLEHKRISAAWERKATKNLGKHLGGLYHLLATLLCWIFRPPYLPGVLLGPPSPSDFFTWQGYLNFLIKPVIYTVFNKEFQQAFQKIVHFQKGS